MIMEWFNGLGEIGKGTVIIVCVITTGVFLAFVGDIVNAILGKKISVFAADESYVVGYVRLKPVTRNGIECQKYKGKYYKINRLEKSCIINLRDEVK